ncbi:MAG TPA: NAD-dependent epimerase/dehydratase family protein [Ramlibacter sp.]|uniref:NAD-dependent epimerase/dehydratase family protein n=1 Tax=Ramlibacter sp. TaxID=1917967 RepID=UPI002D800DC5|nr:NAD-dependent epimerase/dehydratase family protein [Ramlibacter sp.]HET8747347.1 NAD-dependent epimerase/dehydratase family protein [Ramlibacter sp.]
MILVTGAAGFIGAAVAEELLNRGESVLGIDNLNAYYDPQIKRDRLERVRRAPGGERFRFETLDLNDAEGMRRLFVAHGFTHVVHLAAQAGVRHSFTHPHDYVDSNLAGFLNVLEGLRAHPPVHCVYASSSSVYGANTHFPFSEDDRVDDPVSLYAASKRANELMAAVYARQFGLALTGLRFFTVYGPWGRPDMAPMKFTRAILAGEPIDVYNHGDMARDFTYIDDIVAGVLAALALPPAGPGVPHRVFNIGNNQPVRLMHFIDVLEQAIGRQAVRRMLPMQPGDVQTTAADVSKLRAATGWAPTTPIEVGLPRLVQWYRDYFRAA